MSQVDREWAWRVEGTGPAPVRRESGSQVARARHTSPVDIDSGGKGPLGRSCLGECVRVCGVCVGVVYQR